MHKINKSHALLAIIFLILSSLPQQTLEAQSQSELRSPIENKIFTHDSKQNQQIVEGEVIVKYKKSSIDLNDKTGAKKAQNFQKNQNLQDIGEDKNHNIKFLKTNKTTAQTIEDLKNDPNVEYAQPNFKKFPAVTNVNDPMFSQQWDLAKIQAPLAWDNELPSDADVTVAVLDTGVYYNHEDLSQNLWDGSTACKDDTGATISGGCPNHGWDFKDGDKDPIAQSWMQGTQDIGQHGTWVSGVLAATSNNSIGVSGMSHDNHIKIMAVRFGLDTITEIQAINFAKNNGAKIINASFGGPDFDQAEKDAISNFPGIFVTAAGNNGTNNDVTHDYPSDYDNANIVSVAATDQNDNLASFSNYSATSVDIAAPGVGIPTTYFDSNTSYSSVDGTSFAVPLVAGAAAMLESKNPALTASQIKNNIISSGDDIPSLTGKILSGKRLNFANALQVTMNNKVPVFRFWSEIKQHHFYTISLDERNNVMTNDHTWAYEGIGYYAYAKQQPNTTPVYRFWSEKKQGHFYTASLDERNSIIASDPSWVYEGIGYYAYAKQQPNTTPVYRFWSEKKQGHFYTASLDERNNVMTNDHTWAYEGIAFYVPSN